MATYRAPRRLTISRDLERQLREHLLSDIFDPETTHAQKAKYLLDRLDESRRGKR